MNHALPGILGVDAVRVVREQFRVVGESLSRVADVAFRRVVGTKSIEQVAVEPFGSQPAQVQHIVDVRVLGMEPKEPVRGGLGVIEGVRHQFRVDQFKLSLLRVSSKGETRLKLLQPLNGGVVVARAHACAGPVVEYLLGGVRFGAVLVAVAPDERHPGAPTGAENEKQKRYAKLFVHGV